GDDRGSCCCARSTAARRRCTQSHSARNQNSVNRRPGDADQAPLASTAKTCANRSVPANAGTFGIGSGAVAPVVWPKLPPNGKEVWIESNRTVPWSRSRFTEKGAGNASGGLVPLAIANRHGDPSNAYEGMIDRPTRAWPTFGRPGWGGAPPPLPGP